MEEFDIYSSVPHNDLLVSRVAVPSTQEAYVSANIGSQYAVFFPHGRFTVALDPWVYTDYVNIKWLDLESAEWSETERIEVEWEGGHHDWGYRGKINLETPANRACVALIEIPEN
ncbi:MAG: hypothetical protein PF436_09650 [Prolixibacteraceae bacterium]|jgi:hypothetical protein|nr:hypothetical protein [Prolixibacteraceae bacterium]